MPILGAHKSIAGGVHLAPARARQSGCDCVQVFTKNNNQWRAAPIAADHAERFRQALAEHGIRHPLAHDSYLINLASPDRDLWRKSVTAFADELRRAETLGIPYVVTHPGSFTDGSLKTGIRQVVRALDAVHRETAGIRTQCLLETTAGQGSSIGWRFEHLAMILDGVKQPERLGVCLDTCHVFAAGYPLGTREQYQATMDAFDAIVGIRIIKAVHLNDSSRELGSRVDRHAHIGRGKMGFEAFRLLLADRRFKDIPMYLETPKGHERDEDLDAMNLKTLRGLGGNV